MVGYGYLPVFVKYLMPVSLKFRQVVFFNFSIFIFFHERLTQNKNKKLLCSHLLVTSQRTRVFRSYTFFWAQEKIRCPCRWQAYLLRSKHQQHQPWRHQKRIILGGVSASVNLPIQSVSLTMTFRQMKGLLYGIVKTNSDVWSWSVAPEWSNSSSMVWQCVTIKMPAFGVWRS